MYRKKQGYEGLGKRIGYELNNRSHPRPHFGENWRQQPWRCAKERDNQAVDDLGTTTLEAQRLEKRERPMHPARCLRSRTPQYHQSDRKSRVAVFDF